MKKYWSKIHEISQLKLTFGLWAMWLIGLITGLIWG